MIKALLSKISNWFTVDKPCVHTWKIVTKTFASPIRDQSITTITEPKVLEKAFFGVSSYMWQCEGCGEIKKEQMLGSDENELSELIKKVEMFGMQYVKEGDNVYGIAKWVPESTSGVVPLK
jgi:hypothetical protein